MPSIFDRIQRFVLLRQGYRERWLDSSVGTIHAYEARGTGPLDPFVLLHGFSASAGQFGPLMRRLRPHTRRLLALDLPAHGWSDNPVRQNNYDTIRDGLFEALDQLLPYGQQAHIVGNSMGGFAAIRYGLARPERLRSLTLVSPGGAAMAAPDLTQLRSLFQMNTIQEALDFVDRLLAERHPLRRLFAHLAMRQIRRTELQELLQSLETIELLKPGELRALAAPVQLIWGDKDKILPEASRRFFVEHLPKHARIETPQHFGHSPQLEAPSELADLILHFARSHSGARLVSIPPYGADARRDRAGPDEAEPQAI